MRYWRLVGIETPSNTLGLTSLALFDGTTVYPATVLSGALNPTFRIEWDLGSAQTVTEVRLIGNTQTEFPTSMWLERSTDGLAWQGYSRLARIVFPGAGVLRVIGAEGNSGLEPMIPVGFGPLQPDLFIAPDIDLDAANKARSVVGAVDVDLYFGGRHRIRGTVKEKNTPVNTPLVRKVALLDQVTSRAIQVTWSDAAGNYEFFGIAASDPIVRRYTVVSYDHTGLYRAVIADDVPTEPMP